MMDEFIYPHLPLINIEHNQKERYKSRGFSIPPYKNYKEHSKNVKNEATRMQKEIIKKAKSKGINPYLIFKIEYENPLNEEDLKTAGCRLLGDLPGDNQVQVIFSNDQKMEQFFEMLVEYSKGIKPGKKHPSYNRFFANIKSIKRLEAIDRMGPKLKEIEIDGEKFYWIDAELWYSGSKELCKAAQKNIEKIIKPYGKITDEYIGNSLHLLRVKVSGDTLNTLLDEEIICQIDLPPKLQTEGIKKLNLGIDDIRIGKPEENANGVCVIDSGITPKHPLLEKSIIDYNVFRDDLEDGRDEQGHGTFVAGLALYGDIERCIDKKEFIPEVKLFSARVTDENGQLGPSEKLYINQIKQAIEYYNENFNCRVFNISLGNGDKVFNRYQYQSAWAQMLDELVRERDIIVVISSGNIQDFPIKDEEVLNMYPQYLFRNWAGLLDPGTASLCLTVGSLAIEARTSRGFLTPGEPEKGISRIPIANQDQPSPFTRSGLGVNGSIKPDFIAYGGTMIFDGNFKKIQPYVNILNGVISTNYNFASEDKFFGCDIGTSFAAPQIANLAAKILNYRPGLTNNTIRALLASSAGYSEQTYSLLKDYMLKANEEFIKLLEDIDIEDGENSNLKEIIEDCKKRNYISKKVKEKLLKNKGFPQDLRELLKTIPAYSESSDQLVEYLFKISGYGKPNFDKAIYSSDRRVTLFAENTIKVDSFHVYELPVPEDFIQRKGIRKIIISLAYSPLTRHTRKDYHAYSMSFELLRGMDIDEVIEVAGNENKDKKYTNLKAKRCYLKPSPSFLKNSTLQKAEFEIKRTPTKDYGSTYYIVVKCENNWALSSSDFREDQEEPYSIVVTLEHDDSKIEIYEKVQQRIENRINEKIVQPIKQLVKVSV